MKILAIAINTFREAIRNKILYSVILFAVLLIGISALLGSVSIGDQVKVIKDFGLFSLSFCGSLLAIISGTNLLTKELKQKTVYNILSKPVERYQFIMGKWLGLILTTGLLIVCMGTGLIAFVALFEGHIDWLLAQGIYMALLEMTIIASVVLFFSSIVVTTTLTALFSVATYIAGHSIQYFREFLPQGEFYNPITSPIVKIFDTVLPDLSRMNYANYLVYQIPITPDQFLAATAYAAAYSFIALTFAALVFNSRELT